MAEEVYLFPASFAQQRLWFLDQLVPGNPFYNMGAAIRLEFQVNVVTLERSLNEIVRRHETLRTTFTAVDGEPFQVVAPQSTLRVSVDDLQGLPAGERDDAIRRAVAAAATQPFDLARGPLIRARLLRLSEWEYIFLLTMHHVISDGWSIGLLFQELDALYTAFTAGRPSPLPELSIQYADFAVWQRQWLQGAVLEGQLAHWRRQLAGAPVLQLVNDRARPLAQTFRGATERVSFSKEVTERLRALSRQHDATLFMVLLAVFKLLLHQYTGQEDIVVGMPVAGRNHRHVEELIGFFINFLVLRTDLSGDPTFPELLGRVRQVTLNAFTHQDLPFEKLVEELHLERDLSRNPLFQVTFQVVNTPTLVSSGQPGVPASDGRHASRPLPEVQRGTAIFDLACDLFEGPEGVEGRFEYSTDLFDIATVQRMRGHLEELFKQIAAHPNRRLSELSCLTDAERRQLLETWNDSAEASAAPLLLHELFEAQVAAAPDAVAVATGEAQLSYRELNERANQLAHTLRRWGIGPDSLVGICMERSLELVVAMLGALKAGAAYVPIDPSYPAARLRVMLSGVALVLAQPALRDALPDHGPRLVCLESSWKLLQRQSHRNPEPLAAPDNLAYVIYTSGSTGAPKGVMIPHSAICNHMRWMDVEYPLTAADRVLQRTPISFDASVWEFYAPLMAGACLVLETPGSHGDAARLVRTIRDHQITVMQLVPSLLEVLLAEPEIERCVTLRRVFCGGEALSAELQARCCATLPATLHNLYGPTEATIDATAWRCASDDQHAPVPIGRPIANVRAYVLNAHLQPVPIGVPGELYLGGAGLARAYLDQPGLTAERFLPDPFGPQPGARIYRTGDWVRYLSDGALVYVRRTDHQVKLRGYRIELGEVETALRRLHAVRQAVAVVREDVPGDKRLVVYIVPVPGERAPAADEVRQFLRAQLPEHMIPAHIVCLVELPLAPNGKLDRDRLPPPERADRELADSYAAPRTPLEGLLARLWADLLNLERVGIHHGFFNELGGHSLLATQLISRVRDLLGVDVPLQRVFEAPTVAGFAAALLTDPQHQANIERTAEFFEMVEGLSEEEVDAMLARPAQQV